MGLLMFNKKERLYTLSEAKKLLKTEKYQSYTAIPADDENKFYKIVHEEKAMLEARSERLKQKSNEQIRNQFLNRINGDGMYKNASNNIVNIQTDEKYMQNIERQKRTKNVADIRTNKKFNNYQNAKKYQRYLEELDEAR